ncbi:SatD family protein [Ochrovirga pacifica]|uniref:SatD family protein n=1 Tax=Ochrovirga pacifica TaxID=1042376 RepID=UPI00025597D0|nr:SatD family protein [Ochrovirga pacifica]
MKAVITADLINSRKINSEIWLSKLREALESIGKEYTCWEIFRGDSFQILLDAKEALNQAVLIKAMIKQISNLDVRIAIGLGEVTYYSNKVTSSNGPAFVNSGEAFEELKKQTLVIKSPWSDLNNVLEIMLDLATLTMDYWKPTMAEVIHKQLAYPNLKQIEIAELLNKKQSNVSYSLKKSGYDQIRKCILFYEKEIEKRC